MHMKTIYLFAITVIISFSCDRNSVIQGNFSFLVTGNVQGELYLSHLKKDAGESLSL